MSLLRRAILPIVSRRFASVAGSNNQGIQDDPSLTADFVPDFTFPQGLQGEILNGNANDAICQLWLEKCKLYGYNNCEERLQKVFDLNATKKSS